MLPIEIPTYCPECDIDVWAELDDPDSKTPYVHRVCGTRFDAAGTLAVLTSP